MNKSRIASLGLLTSAFFWGISGILTQIALKGSTTMQLIAIRFTIAMLLALIFLKPNLKSLNKETVLQGFGLSSLLMIMYVSSTLGLKHTSASNAGFIVGATVVFVPVVNHFVFRKKRPLKDFLSAIICLLGLGLVTLTGPTPLNKGDLFCLFNTLAYTFYILYSGKIKDETIGLMGFLQYGFVAIYATLYVVLYEQAPLNVEWDSLSALVVLGVFCTFAAFQIQLWAQQYLKAEKVGRLLTFIPIFSVAVDYLVFGTRLTPSAILGGALIILATFMMEKRPISHQVVLQEEGL